MSSELSKNEVLNYLRIWKNWISGPESAKNRPVEFEMMDEGIKNGPKFAFGTILHLYLWFLSKFGLMFGLSSLAIWASRTSIKHDNLWYEPRACGYTNSYSNMGLGYLKLGKVEKAINCLRKSWRVYPCPHNTSYGLKLKLYKKLKPYPEAKEAVSEYAEMWEHFKKW